MNPSETGDTLGGLDRRSGALWVRSRARGAPPSDALEGLAHPSDQRSEVRHEQRDDSEYGWNYSTQKDGRLTVNVRPDATCVLEVEPEGFLPQRKSIRTPKAGASATVIFDLERDRPKATLIVTMKPTGEGPFPPLPPVYRFELTPANGGRTSHAGATSQGTRYVLRNLDAGDYRLVARAGGDDAREGGYYVAAEARLQLTGGATTESVLPVRPGGRLKVILRSPEGRTDVGAVAWLETLNGKRVDLAFAKYTERGSNFSYTPRQGNAQHQQHGADHQRGAHTLGACTQVVGVKGPLSRISGNSHEARS